MTATIPSPARIITRQNVIACGPVQEVQMAGMTFLRVGVNGTASYINPADVASITPLTGNPATLNNLLHIVSDVFGQSVEEITSNRKPTELAEPRFAFWSVALDMKLGTTSEISRAAGRKDHGACIHGRKRAAQLYDVDKVFKAKVDAIRGAINDKVSYHAGDGGGAHGKDTNDK